ncbi:hypothetical protein ACIBKY_21155 [Nonomuraea sp. NPDC050394]|uniref:hypothetical protein n=1 Tax=Nonomuraea sp. NPDC050394 TaxID=3364363 RepID=UPI00379852C6
MSTDIDQIVTRLAPPAGPGLTEGAHDLMNEIMTLSAAPARSRVSRARATLARKRIALPGIATVAAAALAAAWFLGPAAQPAAALDIRREGDHYVIEVKDLYADPGKYEEQLRAAGLNISLRVIPSSPGGVGRIFPTTKDGPEPRYLTEFEQIQGTGECRKFDGCPIGIKIPVSFRGAADVALGREARPGEPVESGGPFDGPDEPMNCVPYLNKTVAEVRDLLAQRGWSIDTYQVLTGEEEPEERTSVPDGWHVTGGYVTHGGKVSLFTDSEPMPQEEADTMFARQNC